MNNKLVEEIHNLVDSNRSGGVSKYELDRACMLLRKLDDKLENLLHVGHGCISYVGAANYAEREREAHENLSKAFEELAS